jgi:hypothetical protein
MAQTKVSGIVTDENNEPIPYANVYFKNSSEGLITNEDGRFYLESEKTYPVLVVSFIGYKTQEIKLTKSVVYNMEIRKN